MKKNFFKKLSFVMALAMIISVIAPAAGAFAATGLRLNATSKTLMLGQNATYNFNVLGKTKGATEKWTTSNAKIAAVNAKNGVVTAKAVGKATITATVTNAKKTVTKKLTAKVNVGDSMKSIKIVAPANAADLAKLTVATDYDFNRSFVTYGGSKTKTSNITVWSLDNEGAKIDTMGVFKAEKAGEYTITARAFRYKAQYDAWVKAGSKADDTKYIIASDSVKVTVANSIKEVKQVGVNKFTVEFAGTVKADELTAEKASVAQFINDKEVVTSSEKIKKITLNADGTVATIEVFGDFVADTTYKFIFGDLNATFKSASKDIKNIAGLVFEDFQVNTSIPGDSANLLDSVYAVNADGVQILRGADISTYLSFENTGDLTKGYVDSGAKKAYIYNAGNSITVKATFTNYVYNETTKKHETVSFNDSATGLGVSSDVDASTIQYAITQSGVRPSSISADWTSPISLAVGDNAYTIHARYKKTTDNASAAYTNTSDNSVFSYVSGDTSKLSIIGYTMYGLSAGTVTVIVKTADGAKVVGSFDVVINPERVLASVVSDPGSVTVGNNLTVGEVKKLVINTRDNSGKDIRVTSATATYMSGPNNGSGIHFNPNGTQQALNGASVTINTGNVAIPVDARGADAGYYQYKITMTHRSLVTNTFVTKEVVVGINVVDSSSTNAIKAVGYAVALEDIANHIPATEADFTNLAGATSKDIAVYAVNSAGYRVDALPDASYEATISIAGSSVTGTSLVTTTLTASGSSLLARTGVYNVSVKADGAIAATPSGSLVARADGTPLCATSFNLKDGYKLNAAVKAFTVDAATYGTVKQALGKALELTVTGRDVYTVDFNNLLGLAEGNTHGVTITGILPGNPLNNNFVDVTNATVSSGNLYIHQVVVDIQVGSAPDLKRFTFDVNKSIVIK